MSDVITIGIAGGTGSGKTTITRRILDEFGGDVSVLYHDNYYKRHDDIPFPERKKLNYDHPNAFDTPLLVQHLDALRAGQAIECPTYDYTVHNRAAETLRSRRPRSSSSRASSSLPSRSCASGWTSSSLSIRTPMCASCGASCATCATAAATWSRSSRSI